MKHPVELATAIEEAIRQARRAYDLNEQSLTKSPQAVVGAGLFQHALDIADATIVLVKDGLPAPALALARPLVESCVRGLWASKCADDQEINDFVAKGRPEPWRLEELAECVKDRIPAEAEWIGETLGRQDVRNMLNDLTHGGRWPVQYRVGGDAVEPEVPIGMQVALLELGNEIRQRSLSRLREMMGEKGRTKTSTNIWSDSRAHLSAVPFREDHLAAFEDSLDDCPNPDEPGQRRCESFAKEHPDVDSKRLPGGKVKRGEVFLLAADPEVNEATVCAAAMAWGGMHVGYWNELLKSDDREWLDIAQMIRWGQLDRAQAYERLKNLKDEKRLKGMGPAFFTKLIYFLTPRDGPERKTAYIMDQWAGSSVNLLTGSELVLMDVYKTWARAKEGLVPSFAFTVSDENTGDDYDAFCSAVDRLADRFGLGADKVDQALISAGEPRSRRWRQYVVAQRPRLVGATKRVRWV